MRSRMFGERTMLSPWTLLTTETYMRYCFVLAAGAAILTIHCSFANHAVGQQADPTTDCKMNDCTAPDKWFVGGATPKAEGDDYPKVDADECDFYKFAWQSFLYFTQPDNAGEAPRFVFLATPNELFDTGGGRKMQVTAAPVRIPTKKQILSLSVRNSPHTSRDIQAKAVAQAGSQGVLVDRNHRCLYYGQHLNSDFVNFIRNSLGLKTADQIKKVSVMQEGFPSGCVELKSSWRALTAAEKQPDRLAQLKKSFFITEGEVPTLSLDVDSAGNKSIRASRESAPGNRRTCGAARCWHDAWPSRIRLGLI